MAGSLRLTPSVKQGALRPLVRGVVSGSRAAVGPSMVFSDSASTALLLAGADSDSGVYADVGTAVFTVGVGSTSESNIGTDVAFSSSSSIPLVLFGSGVELYQTAKNDSGTGEITISRLPSVAALPGAFYPGEVYPGQYDASGSSQANVDTQTCSFTVSGIGIESFSVPDTAYVDSGAAIFLLDGAGVQDSSALDTTNGEISLMSGAVSERVGLSPVGEQPGVLSLVLAPHSGFALDVDPSAVVALEVPLPDALVLVPDVQAVLTLVPE